nr:hypothetical protein [Pseudovibrio sp. Tun.PSC04-5.I4]
MCRFRTSRAVCATNTLQNEIDEATVAVSGLETLLHSIRLLLGERLDQCCEQDVLFNLHNALANGLEALKRTCGIL